jgi:hypothetical protein
VFSFPYYSYPIAPRLLRPVLSIGLPVSYARITGNFPLLADLDERIWAYVDRSIADTLGNLVITRTAQMRLASFWQITHFPKVTQGLQLSDIQVERETHEFLNSGFKSELNEGLASLEQFTLNRILSRAPGFGVRPLVDLLTAIHFHIIVPPIGEGAGCRLNLAQLQQIIQNPTTWRLHSDKYLPFLPKTASFEELQLSVRSQNVIDRLLKECVISDLADLSSLNIGQIMQQPNFGLTSLIDLLDKIQPIVLEREPVQATSPQNGAVLVSSVQCDVTAGVSRPDYTRAVGKLAQSRVANRVQCNDPRLSKLCDGLLYAANGSSVDSPLNSNAFLQQVAMRLAASVSVPANARQLVEIINHIRLRLAEMMNMELEAELRSLAAVNLSDRNIEVVLALWGWSGEPPRTLQSVGDSFGITRERVRQIASKYEKVRVHRKAFLPALEEVLRFIAQRVPVIADDVENELYARHLTLSRFRVESIVECAKQFGQPVAFVLDASGNTRIITEAKGSGLTLLIAKYARRAVSKYGLVNAVDLKEELTDTIHSGIDLKFLSNVIRGIASCEDLGEGWFWLRDLPRNHLITIARKVLAVSPRIHVSEMRAAIANDPRGMGFAPPKQVVLRFCESAVDCDVEDETIIARQQQDLTQILSDTEQVIVDVFRTHGPLLSRAALEEHCVKRGVNRHTMSIYAGRLAIIARYGLGVYGLRGAVFSPDDLAKAPARHERRYYEHGWTENAEPWVAIKLPPSALSNGVVQLPASFRQQVSGRFALRTEDGLVIGQLVVSDHATWGLGTLFRRRGGEPGDILLLTFDMQHRQVTARLGDLAVIPEPGNLAEEVVD